MNIGFYDPISERWIKPRPEHPIDAVEAISLGEALLIATQAAAEKERCARIWAITRQVAEGVNVPTAEAAPVVEPAPIAIEPPVYYVPEFSLGYVYWKPKETV